MSQADLGLSSWHRMGVSSWGCLPKGQGSSWPFWIRCCIRLGAPGPRHLGKKRSPGRDLGWLRISRKELGLAAGKGSKVEVGSER